MPRGFKDCDYGTCSDTPHLKMKTTRWKNIYMPGHNVGHEHLEGWYMNEICHREGHCV
jgi:hypothetical protein